LAAPASNCNRSRVDDDGNAYVTGQSDSLDFPVARAFQPDKLYPAADLFAAKLRADGTSVAYSTYIGGSNTDYGSSIDVDRFGNAYMAGYTYSPDFRWSMRCNRHFEPATGLLLA